MLGLRPSAELAEISAKTYPNDMAEYRTASTALLVDEIGCLRHIERLAKQCRALPMADAQDYRTVNCLTLGSKAKVNELDNKAIAAGGQRMTISTTKMCSALLAAAALSLASCDRPSTIQQKQTAVADAAAQATPNKTGFANVKSSRFYYQIYGGLASAKTPLLVMHGSYMSAEAMALIAAAFAASRPVIAFDARGHGRTGDLPGPITYDQMADDAAGLLDALKVKSADVLAYSLGGNTALAMAIRHPDKVGKQIILSGTALRDGWYPDVNAALQKVTPAAFAGSPLEAAFKRLSPTPNAFPAVVEKLRVLDASNYDRSDAAVHKIDDQTMIVVGDNDAVDLSYALRLFKLRGGRDPKVTTQGFFSAAPWRGC